MVCLPRVLGIPGRLRLLGRRVDAAVRTAESMLHDTLAATGAAGQFERIYGRAVAAGHVGLIASFLAGGFLAGRVGLAIPLALSVAGPWLAAVAIAAGVTDPPRGAASPARSETFRETLRAGLREFRSSVRLLRVIGMTASPPSQAGKIGRSLQSVSSPADSDSCRSSIMSA